MERGGLINGQVGLIFSFIRELDKFSVYILHEKQGQARWTNFQTLINGHALY